VNNIVIDFIHVFYFIFCRTKCSAQGNSLKTLVISHVPIHGNYLIAQGLFHSITTAVSDNQYCLLRQIKLSVLNSKNGKKLTVLTKPIKVYNRISKLDWYVKPDREMLANHPFRFSLEIVDQNKERITSGLDSSLIVEVTIGYQVKTFMTEILVRDFLYKTDAELAGDEVITSLRNYDLVLHKRATKGFVEFRDVVIRTVYQNQFLFLNATLLVPRTGDRQPLSYSDLTSSCLVFFEETNPFFQSEYCAFLEGCKGNNFIAPPSYQLYNQTHVCAARDKSQSTTFARLKTSKQTAVALKIIDLNIFDADLLEGTLNETKPILDTSKPFSVPAYVQIPGLWVMVVDSKQRRIFSGPDSTLKIEVFTTPSVTLSESGRVFNTFRGIGSFLGAVNEIVDEVRFGFRVVGKKENVLESPLSQPFTITNLVHIGLFGRFNTAGAETDPDPVTETFAKLAIEDIRNNISQFKNSFTQLANSNLTIKLKIYDTEQTFSKAVDSFMDMMDEEEKADGNELVTGIIGFGDNYITRKMNILFLSYKLPTMTYREDDIQFISKDAPDSLFGIDWNIADIAPLVGTLLQLQWNTLMTIEDTDFPLRKDVMQTVRKYNYSVIHRLFVGNQTNLTHDIQLAKKFGVKLIFCFVPAPKQYIVYREAIKNEFAPMHGYQWFMMNFEAKQFDWKNKHPLCAMKPTCTEGFQGMQMVYKIQNLSGFSTDLWYHVNRKFFEINHADFRGIPSSDSCNIADRFALGYDAVLTFAYTFEKLLRNSEVFSKYAINQGMKGLFFNGLTGVVRLSLKGGFRRGAIMALGNVVDGRKNTVADGLYMRNVERWMLMSDYYLDYFNSLYERKKRSLKKSSDELTLGNQQTFKHKTEIPIECVKTKYVKCVTPYHLNVIPKPNNTSRLTIKYYVSTCGFISRTSQFISNKKFKDAETICLRTHFVLAPYICDESCGGGRLNSYTSTEYKNGVCYSPNECRCRTLEEIYSNVSKDDYYKIGYSGNDCKNIVCGNCFHGTCKSPYNCSCEMHWTGKMCNVPQCEYQCVHGTCVAPNYCKCDVGYFGDQCSTLLAVFIVAILFGCLVFIALLIFAALWIKKYFAAQEAIRNLDWLVDWKDINEYYVARSILTTPSSTIVGVPKTLSTQSSEVKLSGIKDSLAESVHTPKMIENTADWKGNIYYVEARIIIHYNLLKQMYGLSLLQKFTIDSLDINSLSLRAEIKQLREIKHRNLVRFFGACLTSPNVCLLMEIIPKVGSLLYSLFVATYLTFRLFSLLFRLVYFFDCTCTKLQICVLQGNLADILQTSRYKISWSFKFSILRDIACGMEYLHNSNIGSHGNLKSKYCLIDNRWTCKVTGFGVPTFRKKMYSVDQLEIIYRSMLWTAPELLRISITPNEGGSGTKAGDVYSFGIIVSEICNCEGPFDYELQILSIEELIRLLKNFADPGSMGIKKLLEMHDYDTSKPIRPALTQINLPELFTEKKGIEELVLATTAENPLLRPRFKDIIVTIGGIHPLQGELVQNLIFMLEKYTNHLQDLFNEKVSEIHFEKNKTDNLIKHLLPPIIAKQMTQNLDINPELYQNVTILFSNIVGFTAIANKNCVASGVPIRVPDHYEQIATMALHFVSTIFNFPVRHLPNQRLKIRIGIHSGTCVSGIVGVKMPRYCIFGEDVLIAQYLEANGTANNIQVSGTTARLLDDVGSYFLVFRKEMKVKVGLKNDSLADPMGKFIGAVNVYLLVGKQDLLLDLPDFFPRTSQTKTIESLVDEMELDLEDRLFLRDDRETLPVKRLSMTKSLDTIKESSISSESLNEISSDEADEISEEIAENLSSGRSGGSPIEPTEDKSNVN
uniref:guanylate cyclase n=1 Tax=Strigamia maritima TaxID=126957 RepID=T1JDE2_STRMM